MTSHSVSKAIQPNGPGAESLSLRAGSDDVLERILARMEANDASDAPDLAGAIAAILSARLEGTPVPDDVQATLDAVDESSQEPVL